MKILYFIWKVKYWNLNKVYCKTLRNGVFLEVLYKLHNDDTFWIETCNIVQYHSLNGVVFHVWSFSFYAKVVTLRDNSE